MSTPRRSLPPKKPSGGSGSASHAVSEPLRRQSQMNSDSGLLENYNKNMSGSPIRSQKTTHSKSIRLSDLMAAMYPGMKIGHKTCVDKPIFVPKTMGWLWNTEDTATGVPLPRGWRPGAVALGVRRRNMRSRLMSEPLTTPTGKSGKKTKKKPGRSDAPSTTKSKKSAVSSIAIDVPPTLCIQKEHGVYHVKMRPIKKAHDGDDENVQDEEQPVQFKIADSVPSSCSQFPESDSSSLKIEYLCTGALRKPIKKPELAEMGTQWETTDFEKKVEVPQKTEGDEKKGQKKGKKKKSSDNPKEPLKEPEPEIKKPETEIKKPEPEFKKPEPGIKK